jgi:hypothetical protein
MLKEHILNAGDDDAGENFASAGRAGKKTESIIGSWCKEPSQGCLDKIR